MSYFCQAFGHSDGYTERAVPLYLLHLEMLSGYIKKGSTLWGFVVEWKDEVYGVDGTFWNIPRVCSEVAVLGAISW